jgi:hypothetical protein
MRPLDLNALRETSAPPGELFIYQSLVVFYIF